MKKSMFAGTACLMLLGSAQSSAAVEGWKPTITTTDAVRAADGIRACAGADIHWPPCVPTVGGPAAKIPQMVVGMNMGALFDGYQAMLQEFGYAGSSGAIIDGGFAIKLPWENIDVDGLPLPGSYRWGPGCPREPFDFRSINGLRDGLTTDVIRSREILIVLSKKEFEYRISSALESLPGQTAPLNAPRPKFPREVTEEKITSEFKLWIFVYEYQRNSCVGPSDFVARSKISLREHIDSTRLPFVFLPN